MDRRRKFGRRASGAAVLSLAAWPASAALAATFTWGGADGTNGYFGHGDNWAGGVAPPTTGADLVFASANTRNFAPFANVSYGVNSITFNAAACPFANNQNLEGNALTIGGGGIVDNAANAEAISDPVVLSAPQTWTFAGGGSYLGNGSLNLGGFALTTGVSPGTETLSGTITSTGTAGITKIGAGLLVLNGSGSSIPTLSLTAGTTQLSGGSLTLTSTSNPFALSAGATLAVSGGATFNDMSDGGNGPTIDGPAGTAVVETGAGTTYNTSSSLNVGISTRGALTIQQSAAATVSGGLFLGDFSGSGGTLTVASGGVLSSGYAALGTSAGSVGTATVSGTNSKWTTGTLSVGGFGTSAGGTGTLTVSAGGAVVNTGVTYFGSNGASVNVSGGTFTTGLLHSDGAGVGSITLADPSGGTALTINAATGTDTYSGTISGTGSLLKTGSSTQVLSGVINTTGTATVTGGLLAFAGAGSSKIGALTVAGGAGNVSAGTVTLAGNSTANGFSLGVTGGTATVNGGATLDASNRGVEVDGPAGTTLTVTGSGTSLKVGSALDVGYSSGKTGTVVVSGGAQVSGSDIDVPFQGTGSLSVTSGGSANFINLSFGDPASSLTVSGGGAVNITGTALFFDSVSPLNVSGGTFAAGGLSSVDPESGLSSGLINVVADPAGGTALTINGSSGTTVYSGTIAGAGSLLKTGGSTQVLSGVVNTTGTATVTGGLLVFNGSGTSSVNTLSVNGGAANVSGGTLKLTATTSTTLVSAGVLTVSNGGTLDTTAQTSIDTIDGPSGTGLTVTGAGSAYKGGLELGVAPFSQGTVTVQNGASLSSGDVLLGQNGGSSGTLSIASGGTVTCNNGELGYGTGATATATVSGAGSTLTCTAGLSIGGAADVGGGSGATASLTVSSGGAVVTPLTTFASNTATLNVSGGTVTTGGLNSFFPGNGSVILNADPAGGTALTINGSFGSHTYSGTISGAGSLLKAGGSSQSLSGTVGTTGNATVTGGTLTFNGSGTSTLNNLFVNGGAANVSGGTLKLTNTTLSQLVSAGTLTVSNGATLDATAQTNTYYVDGPPGTGLTVTGAGSTVKGGYDLSIGPLTQGSLSVQLGGTVSNTAFFEVGAGGSGTLTVASGGSVVCIDGLVQSLSRSDRDGDRERSGVDLDVYRRPLLRRRGRPGRDRQRWERDVDGQRRRRGRHSAHLFPEQHLHRQRQRRDVHVGIPHQLRCRQRLDQPAWRPRRRRRADDQLDACHRRQHVLRVVRRDRQPAQERRVDPGVVREQQLHRHRDRHRRHADDDRDGRDRLPGVQRHADRQQPQRHRPGRRQRRRHPQRLDQLPGHHTQRRGDVRPRRVRRDAGCPGRQHGRHPAGAVRPHHGDRYDHAERRHDGHGERDRLADADRPGVGRRPRGDQGRHGTLVVVPFTAASLNVSGGTVRLLGSLSALSVGTLTVAAGTKMDVGTRGIDIGNGSLSAVTTLAAQGFAGGLWNGVGIDSSSAGLVQFNHLTAVGVVQNNQGGTPLFTASKPFDGLTPARATSWSSTPTTATSTSTASSTPPTTRGSTPATSCT